MYDHLMYVNYSLRRYFYLSGRALFNFDLEYAYELLKKLKDDVMREDIFRMRIQGVDPSTVPYYANYLQAMNKDKKTTKSRLSVEDAKAYRNIFDTVLKKVRRG